MSASRKKMLRREENKAAMTERQQQEMKEAKKLKLYTAIFAVVMIAVIGFVLVSSVLTSGIIERNTTALTVNDEKISAVELNYFYIDTVNNFMNTYGSYAAMMGLDTTLSLGEQFYDEEAGQTWSDYFLESATESAKRSYAIYQDAKANGYQLPADVQESIDSTVDTLATYGAMYGFADANGYIKAMYGAGSNTKSFVDYLTVQYIADNYYNDTMNAKEFSAEEIGAKDAENPQYYSSFSYNYYYLNASNFYEGGTTAEDGTTTYTDEEKAAGLEKCKAAADSLAKCTTLAELDEAIAALEINADQENASSVSVVDRRYTSVESTLQEWVTAPERKAGDITCIENAVTTTAEHEHTEEEHEHEEITTVNGYYVVVFNGSSENKTQLVNVRHILVPYEGGTTDEAGITTYTDEEKAAAQTKAQEILDTFLAGEATEDAFAALANEKSTDTGSNTNGGLYEDVYPGQMVTNFNDWCFDASRIAGDTGIVESDYGYHVMFFSSYSDKTHRDHMIGSDLLNEYMNTWQSNLVDNAVLEVINTSKVDMDLMVSGS